MVTIKINRPLSFLTNYCHFFIDYDFFDVKNLNYLDYARS